MEVVLQTKFVFLELQLVSSADISVQTVSTTLQRRVTVNLLCMLYHYNFNNITAAHVASALSFFVVAEAGAVHDRSLIEGSPNKTEDMFDPIIVTDYDAAAATDYNADAEEIYWTSNSSKAIYKAPASGGNSSVLLHLEDGPYPTGLAVDWITGNIYYSTSRGQIATVKRDGSYYTTLVDEPSGNLSSLAVNPLTG